MSTRAPQPEHYSVELEPDDEQWWPGRCSCGADLGPFPTAEDAADGLMQHAYDAGYADALRTVVAMSPAGDANSHPNPESRATEREATASDERAEASSS